MEKERFISRKGKVEKRDLVTPYLAMLKEKIKLGTRDLKVAVDCGNGTVSLFVEKILKAWGCEVFPLYCESDPRFSNHHPDPVKPVNRRI